jgi:hypothetical protein
MALGWTQPFKRNEYQEYFLGVKAAGAWGLQPYHLHVPIVLKSGSLILLEPNEPVHACNGIALPFTLTITSAVSGWKECVLPVMLHSLFGLCNHPERH